MKLNEYRSTRTPNRFEKLSRIKYCTKTHIFLIFFYLLPVKGWSSMSVYSVHIEITAVADDSYTRPIVPDTVTAVLVYVICAYAFLTFIYLYYRR